MAAVKFKEYSLLCVYNTSGLQALTQSGRPLAIKIGELAGAKVQIGRSVRWNREKVESYLNKISTSA